MSWIDKFLEAAEEDVLDTIDSAIDNNDEQVDVTDVSQATADVKGADVSDDPDKNSYDDTDCYSQAVEVGDEKVDGTVDVDLGSTDEEVKPGEQTTAAEIEQEFALEVYVEEALDIMNEAKVTSKKDVEDQIEKISQKKDAADLIVGLFINYIKGVIQCLAGLGAGAAVGGVVGGIAGGPGGAVAGATIGTNVAGSTSFIVWLALHCCTKIYYLPGSVTDKQKRCKTLLMEIDKAIAAAKKAGDDKKVEQLTEGKAKVQAKIDKLDEAAKKKSTFKNNYGVNKESVTLTADEMHRLYSESVNEVIKESKEEIEAKYQEKVAKAKAWKKSALAKEKAAADKAKAKAAKAAAVEEAANEFAKQIAKAFSEV